MISKAKLDAIYNFLKENQKWNEKVQRGYYNEILSPFHCPETKIKALLWRVLNSQYKPKLDEVKKFWEGIQDHKIHSFKTLLKALGRDGRNLTYLELYKSLKGQPSWGDKTSALFVKYLYHIHADNRYSSFAFLVDAPPILVEGDIINLPVDQVISKIFGELKGNKISGFDAVNSLIKKHYNSNDLEVWDDLWFWGFITQKGSGGKRKIEWNPSKYWSILYTPKDDDSLEQVELKAKQFIDLIMNKK